MECMSILGVNLHGVWRHSALCNIHMDTIWISIQGVLLVTWSVEKFYNPKYPSKICSQIKPLKGPMS